MDYFSFGTYDPSNMDMAFAETNGYTDPTSGTETRKELSYPLKELKDYINDLKDYIDDRTGDVYPVGSIYMSVNNTDPSTLFPNTTWEQLKDRFLLGAGDVYTGGTTGGEATHTLTVDEIPSHSHSFSSQDRAYGEGSQVAGSMSYGGTYSHTTSGVGGGNAHNNLPPYLTVYMWKRTA